ncbi:hypothetical protein [Flavobacterium psychrotolerans]|uniref:Uncharacterized protein n=1 Tax=Flavobacterium psychrotolerans TaxID=2169410 RepID=A0A2U1JG24_9FLAO|nr:hypothetical protein [Flavobacterium psychrotolerans]PWA04092.1 hypothetical protein DB895_12960 [Flavobacterium psychrotolerans]
MNIVVFFLYVFSLLPGGGSFLHAIAKNEQNSCSLSIQNLTKNRPVKFSNDDRKITLFEEIDIDLEEDYHNADDASDGNKTIFFSDKYTLPNPWFSSQAKLFVLNYFNNRFETSPPFLGNSYPIYISQRVLRI